MPTGSRGSRKALREELDIHSGYSFTKFMENGIDAHWSCTLAEQATSLLKKGKVSDYWTQPTLNAGPDCDGSLKCPVDINNVSLQTKKFYNYPYIAIKTKMTDMLSSQGFLLGLMKESTTNTGTALLQFWNDGVSERFDVQCECRGYHRYRIDWALPASAKTVRHIYAVKVNKNNIEFYVDATLVVVAISTPFLGFTEIQGPPYALVPFTASTGPPRTGGQMGISQPVSLSIAGAGNEIILPLAPSNVEIGEDDPLPPRVYRLYDAGTTNLFTSLTIAAGSETSHPVPTFGYPSKTFHFRASQNGDIDIEVLTQTNNWRIYSPDAGGHTDSNYTANTLWSFILTGDVVLARLTFTPDTYPCTVSEAEVVMR